MLSKSNFWCSMEIKKLEYTGTFLISRKFHKVYSTCIWGISYAIHARLNLLEQLKRFKFATYWKVFQLANKNSYFQEHLCWLLLDRAHEHKKQIYTFVISTPVSCFIASGIRMTMSSSSPVILDAPTSLLPLDIIVTFFTCDNGAAISAATC